MYNATTWIQQEDKESKNQPQHLADNESLLVLSINPFRFNPVMMDNDQHGERWIAGVHFSVDEENEVNSRYKLFKSVEYLKWFP